MRTLICPPRCRMGALTAEERAQVMARSPLGGKYDQRVNRDSAYEMLGRRAEAREAPEHAPRAEPPTPKPQSATPGRGGAGGGGGGLRDILFGTKRRQGVVETMAKQAGRQILRGVLGGILGGTRRR